MIEEKAKIFKEDDDTIDVKKLLFKILSNWYYFAIMVFITLSISYFINRYTDPRYNLSSSILVKDKDNAISGGVESMVEEMGLFRRSRRKSVENEIGILQSYEIINRTINELLDFHISYYSIGRINTPEKYKSSPFKVILDEDYNQYTGAKIFLTLKNENEFIIESEDASLKQTKLNFNETFIHENFKFKIEKNDIFFSDYTNLPKKYYFIINNLNSLTNSYRAKLNVEMNDKKGTILFLSTTGLNIYKESDFLNKLSEIYIRYGLEEKNQITQNTIRFIDEQLSEITDSLKIAERNLLAFKVDNKVVDIDREGKMIFDQLVEIQTDKTGLNIKSNYYHYLLKYIEDKNNFKDVIAPSVMGINDQLLTTLINSLSQYNFEKETLLYSAKENTPSVNLINLKIQNTKDALIENLKNLISTTKMSIDDVDKRLAKIDIEINKLPVTQRELINVQRKFDLSDNIYTYLLQKRAEAGIAQASLIPDNKVVDIARPENAIQISPKKSLNYMIALVIGLLIPLIIIILLDFLNNKIIEVKDVEDKTNVPISGTIGHNNKDTDLVVLEKPKSSISESFRSLRTNLQYLLRNKDSYVIAITSSVSGEGKTFCAINLGSIIAFSNKKTLLVGLDLRKPKLHKDLNISNEVGMSNFLIGKATLDEIILETPIPNLYVIPSGPVPPNPAELIEGDSFDDFIKQVKARFDYIIIDTPPVALVTDAILLTKHTDANIFVIRQNFSNKSTIKLVNDLYINKNINNLSILINDVKIPGYYGFYGKYSYTYGGYYSYGYGVPYGSGYYDDDEKPPKSFFQKIFSMIKINK
ncbi:MAG: hypothetical protein A2033_15735 [Bacteroidetes bacterium GWA2_31_9]|nr:MAG: hypothetical protein A2033_15735 [Bacteroidetes bacterium GWA2_31_9]